MRPAGDVLGVRAADGHRRRRDVRLLLDRLLDDPRRRRAVTARHGDGAVLLRDVRARRVAGPGRHRPGERLLHVPEGERGRRRRSRCRSARSCRRSCAAWLAKPKGFNLRALEPFRAEGLHTAMYIVPVLAAILAVVLFAASRTVKKDVAKAQDVDEGIACGDFLNAEHAERR